MNRKNTKTLLAALRAGNNPLRRIGNALLLVGALMFGITGPRAMAADQYWDVVSGGGNPQDGVWDLVTANWDPLGLPTDGPIFNGLWSPGDRAVFASTAGGFVTVVGVQQAGSGANGALLFSGTGSWSLTGGTLSIGGTGSIDNTNGSLVDINSAINGVAPGQALNINVTGGGGYIDINGNIGSNIGTVTYNSNVDPIDDFSFLSGSNSFTGGLVVQDGELRITGANTYTGVTNVQAGGVATVQNNTALGAVGGGNGTVVASGGTVRIDGGGLSIAEDFTITGTGAAPYLGAIHNSGSNAINGRILLTSNPATIHSAAGTLTISGGIFSANGVGVSGDNVTFSGPGNITVNSVIGHDGSFNYVERIIKTGTGVLDLRGAHANNYLIAFFGDPPQTEIVNGTVIIDSDNKLGTGGGIFGLQEFGVFFNGAAGDTPTLRIADNSINFAATDRHFTVQGEVGQISVDAGLTATIDNAQLHFTNETNILRQMGAGTLVIDATGSGVGNTANIFGTLDPDSGTLTVLGSGFSGLNPTFGPGGVPLAGTTTLYLNGLGDADGGQTGIFNAGIVGFEFDNVIIDQSVDTIFDGTFSTTGDLTVTGTGTLTMNGPINVNNIHIVGNHLIVTDPAALGDFTNSNDQRATFIWGSLIDPLFPNFPNPEPAGRLSLSGGITILERLTIVNEGRLDNLDGDNTINSAIRIQYNGGMVHGAYSTSAQIGVTADTLTLNGGIFSNPGQSVTINGLGTDTGTVIVEGSIQSTVHDVLLGNSANTTNTVELNALNAYHGQTYLNGGNVVVGNNAAFSAGNVIVNEDTNLQSNVATTSLANNIFLNATLTTGITTGAAPNNVSLGNTLVLNGSISGIGGITAGGSITTLGGNNLYTGATNVDAGTLNINGTSNSNEVNVAADAILNTGGADKLADSAVLTVAVDGEANLGGNETIGRLITSGEVNVAGRLTTTLNSVVVNVGGTLNAVGVTTTSLTVDGGGGGAGGNGLISTADIITNTLNGTTAAATITIGANTITAQSGSYAGQLIGAGGSLVKNGGGTLTLSGDNSALTGSTTVNGGILAVSGALGTPTVTVNGGALNMNVGSTFAAGTTVTTSGVVNIDNEVNNTIANLNINLPSGEVNLVDGDLTTGTLNGVGTINLNDNTLSVASGFYSGTINGDDDSNLTKTGPGLLTLAGSNAYTGATNVTAGTLNALTALSTSEVNIFVGATYLNTGGLIDPLVAIDNDGIMTLFGNEQASVYNSLGGELNGTGVLTAATYNLDGTVADPTLIQQGAGLGTGVLNSGDMLGGDGIVFLFGNSAANDVNVLSGTMSVGGNLGSPGATVDISAGATLQMLLNLGLGIDGDINDTAVVTNAGELALNGPELVASYTSNGDGTLSGTGVDVGDDILTAANYNLNNNSVVAANAGIGEGILTVTGAVGESVLLNGTSSADTIIILSGGLTIAAGSLLTDGPGNVVNLSNNGVLTVAGDNTITTLTNNAPGTVTGGSTLTVTGATVFNGGELVAGTTILADGGATLNDGTVIGGTLNGDITTNGTVTVNVGGLLGAAGNTLTVNGPPFPSSSTLFLNGTSTHETVQINAGGVLVLGSPERLANTATVTNDGTMTLNGLETIAAYISNGGLLNGNGNLTAATYDLNDGSIVDFNVVLGTQGGGSHLTTNGQVQLNGTSNADRVTIETGSLNGAGPLNYILLEGNGILNRSLVNLAGDTVNPGLNLDPSTEIGALTIAGDFTNQGILEIDANVQPGAFVNCVLNTANHDVLNVGGATDLSNGTIVLDKVAGSQEFQRGERAQIINSNGPITVNANTVFDTSDWTGRNLFDFRVGQVVGTGVNQGQTLGALPGLTDNQIIIADIVSGEALPGSNIIDRDEIMVQLLLEIIGDCNSDPGFVLDLLSPESYAGFIDYGIQVTRSYTKAALNMPAVRISSGGGYQTYSDPKNPKNTYEEKNPVYYSTEGTSIFAGYTHFDAGTDSSVNRANYGLNSNGAIVGLRHESGALTLAAFVGLDEGEVSTTFLDADAEGTLVGGVISYVINPDNELKLTAGLTYGSYEYDGVRQTVGGPAAFRDVDSDVFDFHAGISGNLGSGGGPLTVTPFLHFHYVTAETDGFTETGPIGALAVNGLDDEALFSELGVRVVYEVNSQFSVNGLVSYTHNFSDTDRNVTATFVNGGGPFTVTAPGLAENLFTVGVGADYQFNNSLSVGVNYRAEFSDADVANGLSAGATYRF